VKCRFNYAILFVLVQGVVQRKANQAVSGVFCDGTLAFSASKLLTNRRSMQRLVVEDARNVSSFHVVNEPGSLFGSCKTHVIHVADVLTAFWNNR